MRSIAPRKELHSVFGGPLISMNKPPRKEEGSYTYSSRMGGKFFVYCKALGWGHPQNKGPRMR
jgi:hypothetical protein